MDRSSLTKSKHADRKNDKQKLDQQFQKIQQIMKKRDEKKGKGNSEYWSKITDKTPIFFRDLIAILIIVRHLGTQLRVHEKMRPKLF